MRRYKLEFTDYAEEDLGEIYTYIAEELYAPASALRIIQNIEDSILRLLTFPLSCPAVNDPELNEKGFRKLVIDKYIVFYKVNETKRKVIVHRVLYGAMDFYSLL